MANYISHHRTNYFRLKDVAAFKKDLERYGIEVQDKTSRWADGVILIEDDSHTPEGAVMLLCYDSWPSLEPEWVADRLGLDEGDTSIPDDATSIFDLIARHIVETDVAIVMGVGQEKMRYLNGYAVAIDSTGVLKEISTEDIYDAAKALAEGKTITVAAN